MYLRYGSYTHSLQEASVSIDKEALKNEAGDYYAINHVWQIRGRLVADDQSALIAAINALEAAYSSGGYDLELLLPDASTAMHSLLSASCRGGTKISKPVSYPVGDGGAEGNTIRTYDITVEGEVPLAVGQNPYVSWQETLQFIGDGGPQFVIIPCRNGPPQKQIVSQFTPVQVIQTGSAVGYSAYPLPPGPIWPQHEQRDRRQISLTAPRTTGGGTNRNVTDYGIGWVYTHLAPGYLAGLPNPQP